MLVMPLMALAPLAAMPAKKLGQSVGDPDIDSEKLDAVDFGWHRQWSDGLRTDITEFSYRHSELRGTVAGLPAPPYLPLGRTYPRPISRVRISPSIGVPAKTGISRPAINLRAAPQSGLKLSAQL